MIKHSRYIEDIKKHDIVWECKQGQDAPLLALEDCQTDLDKHSVRAVDIADGKPVLLMTSIGGSYSPKLYSEPQYTKPTQTQWCELMQKLARLMTLPEEMLVTHNVTDGVLEYLRKQELARFDIIKVDDIVNAFANNPYGDHYTFTTVSLVLIQFIYQGGYQGTTTWVKIAKHYTEGEYQVWW